MVYEKKKSGDPDFDDKQPADMHAGVVVTAGDGTKVLVTEDRGPVTMEGAHYNLDEAPDERDNRPAPGEVATDTSEVQTYAAEDTPAKETTIEQYEADHADGSEAASADAEVAAPAPAKKAAPAKRTGSAAK